jgi:hypothetical protein
LIGLSKFGVVEEMLTFMKSEEMKWVYQKYIQKIEEQNENKHKCIEYLLKVC